MTEPMTADRPTTVAEAVEVGARVLLASPGDYPGEEREHEWAEYITSAVLAAVEYADLLGEVERLHTWAGLMELLDEHWPADIWPMLEDDLRLDAGHRVTSAMRWIDQLRTERDALAATVARTQEALRRVRSIGAISGTNLNSWNAAFVVIDAALHPEKGADRG